MVQRFDEKRLELIGEPLPVAERVGSSGIAGYYSITTNGVLAYRSGENIQISQPEWFDRQGKVLGRTGEPSIYFGVALSPNGTQVALANNSASFSSDLWLIDLARGTNTRFTFGQGYNFLPIWSPDGSRIIFASDRGGTGDLYQKLVSGVKDEEVLLKSSNPKYPTSLSGDGRFLLYTALDPKTNCDLWVLPLQGDRKPIPLLQTNFNEFDGHFSPDMRWVAYVSDESGKNEIYVRGISQQSSGGAPLETVGKWLVSKGGGTGPRWRGDGKELYYRALDGRVMAMQVATDTAFKAGTPEPLFQTPPDVKTLFIPIPYWDVTSNGSRFILWTQFTENTSTPFTIVLNWPSLLKK
jgi:Tol biopolymer transport system component